MRDLTYCGTAPPDEPCAQVGAPDYYERARAECAAWRNALRLRFGPEPEGARLAIKTNAHDFGSYLEVVCYFEEGNEAAADYAYKCEGEGPATWEEAGVRPRVAARGCSSRPRTWAISRRSRPLAVLAERTK